VIKNLLIVVMALNLIACNSTPKVTNSWMNQNCKSLATFTPDKKPRLSYCKSFDGMTQTCKRKNFTYEGTFLNGNMHGEGETTRVKSSHTYIFKGIYKNGEQWCGISQLESGYNEWVNGKSTYHDQQIDWDKVLVGAALVAVAAAASSGSGGASSSQSTRSGFIGEGTRPNPPKVSRSTDSRGYGTIIQPNKSSASNSEFILVKEMMAAGKNKKVCTYRDNSNRKKEIFIAPQNKCAKNLN
jgi:hypothetical protein